MASQNLVNIGSGDGLLPDGTKPLPEPMLSSIEVLWHTPKAISQEMLKVSILDMSLEITVNIGSGDGLLSDGTKPLPEPMLSSIEVLWHTPKAISQEMLKVSILDMSLEITSLRLWPYLPGANELKETPYA